MLTFLLVVGALILVIGLVYLVMASGQRGGRHRQASAETAHQQESLKPRNSVRTSGGAND